MKWTLSNYSHTSIFPSYCRGCLPWLNHEFGFKQEFRDFTAPLHALWHVLFCQSNWGLGAGFMLHHSYLPTVCWHVVNGGFLEWFWTVNELSGKYAEVMRALVHSWYSLSSLPLFQGSLCLNAFADTPLRDTLMQLRSLCKLHVLICKCGHFHCPVLLETSYLERDSVLIGSPHKQQPGSHSHCFRKRAKSEATDRASPMLSCTYIIILHFDYR